MAPASSSSRSFDRHPLKDLPLDAFTSAKKQHTTNKRPISPASAAFYSPVKRRILSEEGMMVSKPSSSKQASKYTRSPFVDVLMGHDSPARKLDFGPPKNAPATRASSRPFKEEERVSWPGSLSKSRSHPNCRDAEGDCFSIPQSHSNSKRHLEFLTAPRELPPPMDPQSEHYPGFTVYQDPHILIPVYRTSPLTSSASPLAPLDTNLSDDPETEMVDPREPVKENLAPRKKSRKSTTANDPEKGGLCPSSSGKLAMLITPKRCPPADWDMASPRRSIYDVGPGNTQYSPSKDGRRVMRKLLEAEVDGE